MASSLEAQAAAVRNALRGKVSSQDRQALEMAHETLDDLAKLRRKILDGASKLEEEDLSDDVCADIIRLLSLPTGE